MAAAALLALAAPPAEAKPRKGVTYEAHPLEDGLFLPYPLDNLFRGFAECYQGKHGHRALDIGGVGKDWGVGTPIRAIARSKVTNIGLPDDNPNKYGVLDKRPGRAARARTTLPRSKTVPGYGRVYFFTKTYGSSRTGILISTKVLEGRLKGYTVRYMHLGAVHPALKKGSIVEGGQEIGLMGGTAVQRDAPHLHISIQDPAGEPLDVGLVLGIGPTRVACSRGPKAQKELRAAYSKKGRALMANLRKAAKRRNKDAAALARCEPIVQEGKLRQSRNRLPMVKVPASGAPGRWRATLEATGGWWRPRIEVFDETGKQRLHTGSYAKKFLTKRFQFAVEATGQRGKKPARLAFTPRKDQGLTLRLGPWKKKQRQNVPFNARYKLTLERPCPGATQGVAAREGEGGGPDERTPTSGAPAP